jgi:hypothetical protein
LDGGSNDIEERNGPRTGMSKEILIEWCCLHRQSHIVQQEGYHQSYREHVGTTSYDRYSAGFEMKIVILVTKILFIEGKNITMFGADP